MSYVSVILPWIDRTREHIHNHHGEQIVESWKFSDLGDVRLSTRYQHVLEAADTLTLSYVSLEGA